MSEAICEMVERLYPRLVEIRHELHANPELSHRETQTAQRIEHWLAGIGGLEIRTGLARGTGVLATLNTGRPGPVVAFRADMDALPITEETGLPYASKNPGIMHACGHEGHVTCLIGLAMLLSGLRDQLGGVFKFVFQPAEENGRGGEMLVADGVLDNPPVQAIFALHGWPAIEVGRVATRPGPLMASTDSFAATIHGKGAHGAAPHMGIDPIVAASAIVVALQSVIARTLDPLKSGVVTIGLLHGGSAINIIPTHAEMGGTIRALEPAVREHLRTQVEQVIRHTAAAHGCRADINFDPGYPVTANDPRMTRFVIDTAREVVGPDNVDDNRPPSMGGEDFSFYLEKVPGCFFFIGTRPRGQDEYPSIHTPRYDFTDEAIGTGLRMLGELATRCNAGALETYLH